MLVRKSRRRTTNKKGRQLIGWWWFKLTREEQEARRVCKICGGYSYETHDFKETWLCPIHAKKERGKKK